MKTVGQLLDAKGHQAVSVAPDETVYNTLSLMAQHDIGAVLVVDQGKLTGIFTERDYARKVALHGKASREMPVREIMTEKVFFVKPDCTTEEAMALMTDKRCRHLPVLDTAQKVIGIVSIGDLVKETISQQEFIIRQLEAYILG